MMHSLLAITLRSFSLVGWKTRAVSRKALGGVVAVAGRLSPQPSIIVSVDADELPVEELSDTVPNRNPARKDRLEVRVRRIKPSLTSLEDLGATPYRVNESTLQDYAADLLAAFRDLSRGNMRVFMSFIVRSCLPKISHRLGGDIFVFKRPLDDILDGWVPTSGDSLNPKRVRGTDAFVRHLPSLATISAGENQYEWNINTASTWIAILCHLIKEIKRLARACHSHVPNDKIIDTKSLKDLTMCLSILHFLSHHVPLRELLSLPSIRLRLESQSRDTVSIIMAEDEPDMAPEAGEDASLMAHHYLCNVSAWMSAMEYVFASMAKSPGLQHLMLDFLATPVSTPGICAPADPIIDTAIESMVRTFSLDPKSEATKSIIGAIKEKVLPVQFTGTVHCEASLMGMIVACKDHTIPSPNGMKHEELEIFEDIATKDGWSAIGMGKKCCWCCSWLARWLPLTHPSVSFNVPASHGLISQWALPAIGISLVVAENMERALMEVWCRQVVKFACDYGIGSRSGTQRPPFGPVLGDEPWLLMVEAYDELEALKLQGM